MNWFITSLCVLVVGFILFIDLAVILSKKESEHEDWVNEKFQDITEKSEVSEAFGKNRKKEEAEEDEDFETSTLSYKLPPDVSINEMPMCDSCPYKYLNVFLDRSDQLDDWHVDKQFMVKCTHMGACKRARYLGRKEERDRS
ncbi:MAG: hypothetical protein IJ225_10435 [Solobacterium sp.]|nr:hypothetical protein [Solobacterium sp.]